MEPPPGTILEIARGYVAAGLSVIPIRPDGSKAPAAPTWKEFMTRRAADEELVGWFNSGRSGIAIICGAVSGNLEVLDFEDVALFDAWEVLMRRERPIILGKLPIVATPRPGRHVFYRLPHAPRGSEKIATRPPTAEELIADPGCRSVTLIETKAEGGYVLAPGCPPACHETGRLYRHIGGPPLTRIPVIGTDDVSLPV